MKKIFALPGILLPISLLIAYAFIGNSAIDITYYNSTNLLLIKLAPPVLISWVFHIVLGYIKRPSKRWAWLQAGISIISLFIAYFSLAFPMPRRYYEYNAGWINNFFTSGNAMSLLSVTTLYITQIAFWVYGVVVLVKTLPFQKKNRIV